MIQQKKSLREIWTNTKNGRNPELTAPRKEKIMSKILIVDDSPSASTLLMSFLEK
jgi:PleD family two-component response regulator